jgi:hypothetical protein
MEAHNQPSTSTIVEQVQPAPQQEASTSQQAIQPPHPTAATAEQHLRLRLVPQKKKKKKVRFTYRVDLVDILPILIFHAYILQGVAWAEDVVDNELMGKKKSKSKCLYFYKQFNNSPVFIVLFTNRIAAFLLPNRVLYLPQTETIWRLERQ